MLQQTQVRVVVPYFEAFLERFPDVESLAAAPLEDVLARWSGLGYYRRARQLHAAAQAVVERGGFPRTAAELRKLPGFGPYTSAAVASIAFGECVAALDGNLERVLCRLHGIDDDPKRAAVRRRLLEHAEDLLDPRRPGDGNQALMELGATHCRPKRPQCLLCPLTASCEGRRSGEPERFPPPRRRRETERVDWTVAVVRHRDPRRGDEVLFFRRHDTSDLLAGLWELPTVDRAKTLRETENALTVRYGGRWKLARRTATVKHAITYRDITLHGHFAEQIEPPRDGEGSLERAWVGPNEVEDLGLSSMFGKILHASGLLGFLKE